MSAKTHSLKIESILCKINQAMYQKSDEILSDPYQVIISAIEYRVPNEKLDKFKLHYQAISGKTLQELLDDSYDLEGLVEELQNMTEND